MIPQVVGTMGPIHHNDIAPRIEELLLDASLHHNSASNIELITELKDMIPFLLNQCVEHDRQLLSR